MPRALLALAIFFCLCAPVRSQPPSIVADPKWDAFGDYLKVVVEKVQRQWARELTDLKKPPPIGAAVQITFSMNAAGQIIRMRQSGGRSQVSFLHACFSAIRVPAPYGVWTSEMRAVLGEEQEMTFSFNIVPDAAEKPNQRQQRPSSYKSQRSLSVLFRL